MKMHTPTPILEELILRRKAKGITTTNIGISEMEGRHDRGI